MSILVIGQSSFLAKSLQHHKTTRKWHFLGHADALNKELWPENIKTVINCAYDPKIKQGEISNFDYNLAQYAKDINAAYIMLSSRTVYGVPPEPTTITENDKMFEAILPYGNAKRHIEQSLIDNFSHVTILRLSNIFGFEYEPNNERETFFGMMLKNLKEKGVISFNMNSMTQRDFLPIQIFCHWLSIIAHNPKSGIFNLGAGFGTSVSDIANAVIDGYGQGTIIATNDKIIDSFVLDMTHARSNYHLDAVTPDLIEMYCFKIGQKLRKP